jgi:hypothetical protein
VLTLAISIIFMSAVDYHALGFKDLIVTLDGSIAVVLLNRPKQYEVYALWPTDALNLLFV